MRLIVEAFGRRVIDLEILAPVLPQGGGAQDGARPSGDPHSTVAAHIEQGDDGVSGPFGFAPVVKACGAPSPDGILCRFPPGSHGENHSWSAGGKKP